MRANRACDCPLQGLPLPPGELISLRVDVAVETDRRSAVVRVAGEVDAQSADLLMSRLVEASEVAARVVVDLSDVTFMDSTGLQALVGAYCVGGQDPEGFVLRSPSPKVARLLNLAGLDDLFTVEPADDLYATLR